MRPGLAVLLGFSVTMEEFKQEKQFLPFAEIACSCYQKYLCYSLSYVSNMWVADDSQDIKANISYKTTDTSDTICTYPLAINRIRVGPQSTPQEGSYHHSLMEEQHMPDGHPSRY